MPVKKYFFGAVVLVSIISALIFALRPAYSDELDDLTKKINDLQAALDSSKKATTPLESQVNSLRIQMQSIENQVAAIKNDIAVKKQNIEKEYKTLAQKQAMLNKAVRSYYIKNSSYSPLVVFLSASDALSIARALAYQQVGQNQDKAIIANLALSITSLEKRQIELQNEQLRLTAATTKLSVQQKDLQKIVDGARAYQKTLTSQIAELSAKQQQLLAQKQASLGIPLYAYNTQGGCSSDLANGRDPGFSPKFAFFTYGVPNRVGLNQYGAWGRAKAGQDADTILRAYYNFDNYQTMDTTIKVNDSNGYNSGNIIWSGSLDDYVKRIWEVPDSWADNNLAALKAQAIAARSYVMAQTDNGAKSICATTYCQVFKSDPKGGNWEQAVSQTAGQVMIQTGKPITAYFSSTHGGYVYQTGDIGWSQTSFTKRGQDASGPVNNWADLQNNAYDKASPWFYCDWGSRSQYSGTAWLKSEEVADIANVIMLLQTDTSIKENLYQTDKPNPSGKETWSQDRVKQELKNRGGTPFNSVDIVTVSADFGIGKSTTVSVNGDVGQKEFAADLFKTYFNIRAPSNINIVGPLYNVEKR